MTRRVIKRVSKRGHRKFELVTPKEKHDVLGIEIPIPTFDPSYRYQRTTDLITTVDITNIGRVRWYRFDTETKYVHEVPNINDWGEYYEKMFRAGEHRIAYTMIDEGLYVSTIFMGLDHGFMVPYPILFETMVIGGDYDNYVMRSSLYAEAVATHVAIVETVRSGGLLRMIQAERIVEQLHDDNEVEEDHDPDDMAD